MNDLKERFDAIQRACDRRNATGMQFDEKGSLIGSPETQRPVIGPARLHLGPPASVETLDRIEKALGYAFPLSMRKFFEEKSASFGVSWTLKESRYKVDGYSDIYYGEFILNFTELYHLLQAKKEFLKHVWDEKDERIMDWLNPYRTCVPMMELRNGDTLLMGVGDDKHQEIVYFMHDALDGGGDWYKKHARILAENFEDFLDRWSQLAFIGPEHWVVEPFLGQGGIDPTGEHAKGFRQWFFDE